MPEARESTPALTLDQVLADPPIVHGSGDELLTHGLLPVVLEYLVATVQPDWRTLETGSGLSTIVFALAGAQHTAVMPDQNEADRITAWCEQHDVDLGSVTFQVEGSQRYLPGAQLGELDLVLIDGSHSFPHAFIDWYYTHEALRVGGTVVVDDVHVWTGRVLRDFLAAEPEWELTGRWQGRTVAFRKTAEADPDKVWDHQPYVNRKTQAGVLGRARMAGALVREGDFGELAKRVRATISPRG
jgi:hypothetical protein